MRALSGLLYDGEKKANPKVGFFKQPLITWMLLEQKLQEQLVRMLLERTLQEQKLQELLLLPMRRKLLELQQLVLERQLEQKLQEQELVLEQQLLLSCCKLPKR
jgi:hypothetical protein